MANGRVVNREILNRVPMVCRDSVQDVIKIMHSRHFCDVYLYTWMDYDEDKIVGVSVEADEPYAIQIRISIRGSIHENDVSLFNDWLET